MRNRHDHIDIRGHQLVGPPLGCLPGEHPGDQFLARLLPSTSARPEQPAAVANKPDARPPRKEKPAKKATANKAAAPRNRKVS